MYITRSIRYFTFPLRLLKFQSWPLIVLTVMLYNEDIFLFLCRIRKEMGKCVKLFLIYAQNLEITLALRRKKRHDYNTS